MFVVSARLDELFIQLCELIFLLRVLGNEFDQFRTDRQSLVVQRRDLLVVLDI